VEKIFKNTKIFQKKLKIFEYKNEEDEEEETESEERL